MTLSTKYNPREVEDKWYKKWMDQGFFHSKPNPKKEPYTIVIPPPNVTGVLHMGHMLNNTIQDILIRRARMLGKEACWVPGTDHASIATEAKVVKMLKDKGIKKSDISREEFLKYSWEWTEKYGGIILEQLKKLGASCDWNRVSFTMDDDYYDAVIKTFVDLHKKGHIYRGYRMVNWDPVGLTALADDEVIHKEVSGHLYYLDYNILGEKEHLTIATTRPETILGDTAICINPNDARFTHLHGKKAIVPLINREVPIILDDYVDMEFGTGCLKVTPAHDVNDYELGQKHDLESIDIFNDDGSVNSKGKLYTGQDRFKVRKLIVKDLDSNGHLNKIEDYTNNVGYSERTDAVIEPRLSLQWYVRMEDLTKPAFENVMNDEIQLVPSKFKNMYRHWMENVRDWCISRQLWWGQRIPAWYLAGTSSTDPEALSFVAENAEEALLLAQEKTGNPDLTLEDIHQDEDVLDTWFSSGLWPIEVFKGISNPDNEEIKYYYPTNDLVTAPEILFFWVARMALYGYEYMGEKPFSNVYLTGIVRDRQGRKMSKSLGNSPDPLELIEQNGADGVRTGMLFSSPAGNDLPFDEKLVKVAENSDFPIQNLPFGIFRKPGKKPRVGVAIGDQILDVARLYARGFLDDVGIETNVFKKPSLNEFLSLGKNKSRNVRERISELLPTENNELHAQPEVVAKVLVDQKKVEMLLPVQATDYTDFYSSVEHATNVGTMFRDPANALLPNWKHLPVAYHGRSGSIVPSGVDLHRPNGQTKGPDDDLPTYGPSKRVDFELEMAFITCGHTTLGTSISTAAAENYIFGFSLFNDWSARDIQAWEYVPLGPFLSKNFGWQIIVRTLCLPIRPMQVYS